MEELNNLDKNREVIKIGDNQKKSKLKNRIIAGISCVVVFVILGVIKSSNPSFPSKWIIIIGGSVLVFGLLLSFWFNISEWWRKRTEERLSLGKVKLPTKEEITRELNKSVMEDFNWIKQTLKVVPFSISGNYMYAYHLLLYYEMENVGKDIWVVVNANHLYEKPFGVTNGDASLSEIKRIANGLADNSESEERETSEVFEPTTGRFLKHTKIVPKQKEDTSQKPKEEIK
jgi:hypothetical protein